MIYTKNKLKDGTVVCGPVTAENTYTRCADCGKEIQMDLRELILAGAQDPYDTEVNCAECSAKMMHRGDINIDNIIRLTDVLKDISFTANPGDLIAVVGPSGAGKSSFANLLLRFYDPSEGAVYLDGQDIRNLKINALRRHIGFVQALQATVMALV